MATSESDARPTVGFVGVGDMGGRMVRRILDAGFPTVLWARRPDALNQFAAWPFETAANLVELAARSDVIGVCVYADADVREVVLDPGTGLVNGVRPGAVVAIHSTISVETCLALSEPLRAVGADVVDAPVTGGRAAVDEGRLGVMVGGAPAAFERCLPVMRAFGGAIKHLGPLGSGQRAKLVNNALATGNACLASIALETAHALGLDVGEFVEVLGAGGANSHMLHVIMDRLLHDDEFLSQFLTTMSKDASLFVDMCRSAGLPANALIELCEGPIDRTVPRSIAPTS